MKRVVVPLIALGVLVLLASACAPTPQEIPTPIVMTRVVTVEVPKEVTVEVPKEVTVEVPKEVIVEVPKEVTGTLPGPAEQAYEWLPTSLHGTTRGKAYWYSKENGGMETLTGVPYEQLPCQHCHTLYNKVEGKVGEPRCESCHINREYAPVQAMVKLPQFPDDGRAQGCLACHGRQRFEWGATKPRVDAEGKPVVDPVTGAPMTEPVVTDVHRNPSPYGKGIGLTCVNCHGIGDTHGDGNIYNTMLESPNTECTTCHPTETLSQTPGHTIHGKNVTCEACHAQTVVSCQGCHLNGVLAGLPEYPHARVAGWKFLVLNQESKYDLGNVMAAVYTTDAGEAKTFVAIGPYYSHSIKYPTTREEKVATCAACHTSDAVKAYTESGTIVLSRWDEKEGKLVFPTKGVVPIPKDYQTALRLAFPYITNIDEVLAAKKEGKPQTELEKLTRWAFGKDTVDLWQMLFAKPVEKMPPQMPKEALESFFPAQ